ncbi:MAG: hypothetical protein ACPGF7_12960 [Pontibacterium sp.]
MTIKKLIVLAVILPTALGLLGIGGYFGYHALIKQSASNQKELEKFGLAVLPEPSLPEGTAGATGSVLSSPTFSKNKLTATQRVIQGLMADKENLINEQQGLREENATLKTRIAELEEYQRLNEHFAPQTLVEELRVVKRKLKKQLQNNPGAARFNNRQIDIVSNASVVEYEKFIRRNRLILSNFQQDELIHIYLPEFAFCLGDGVDVATNSPTEERNLARFFSENDPDVLNTALRRDLDTVLKPCQVDLYENLAKYSAQKQP